MPLLNYIKKFFQRNSLGPANKGPATPHSAQMIPEDEHAIPREHISVNAQKVLSRLNKMGYSAYLVGGGVRDLLLNKTPKDFDIVTDARPEQIKNIFRNCRLIGKRFRLAHILFGRSIIEVATFRASDDNSTKKITKNPGGMLVQDNVYGNSLEEDIIRRDFTINALYYNGKTREILDFANGLSDLKNKTIRMMGDAEKRYREDPVRILRAVRFAAKLHFTIDQATQAPIEKLSHLLHEVSNSRLFEETQKLFLSGHSNATLDKLREFQCFSILFPTTHKLLEKNHTQALNLIRLTLDNSDARIKQDKPITIAFILASMLWYPVQELAQRYQEENIPPLMALEKASQVIIHEQSKIISLPRRVSLMMKDIWVLQYRLEKRSGDRAFNLLENRRFRAAYDFLVLRGETGEAVDELVQWWTQFQYAEPEIQQSMVAEINPKKRRRKLKNQTKKVAQP